MVNVTKPLNQQTIFVALTAFNDRYIQQTITSALSKAKHPERISFGILEHRVDDHFFNFTDYKQIKHIKLEYAAALGLGTCRTMTLALYDQEDFIFQIDAHMLFDDNGDEKIIEGYFNIYEDIQDESIVISNLPPWWNFNDDGTIYYSPKVENGIAAINYHPEPYVQYKTPTEFEELQKSGERFVACYTKLENGTYQAAISDGRPNRVKSFDSLEEAKSWLCLGFNDSDGYPKYGLDIQEPKEGKKYREHFFFVAHYAFATAKFFHDIYLSPIILFGGEEPTIAMRAGTRGYRFFNISSHILWHFNKLNLKDPEDRVMNPGQQLLIEHYNRKDIIASEHVRQVLTGDILGYGGAPDADSLAAYEKAVNFNFKQFYAEADELNKTGK